MLVMLDPNETGAVEYQSHIKGWTLQRVRLLSLCETKRPGRGGADTQQLWLHARKTACKAACACGTRAVDCCGV